MKTIHVYDKPMCCSTGVCGPQVDPALARFAADLDWLKTQGNQVERFNLAQQPGAFAENSEVRQILAARGNRLSATRSWSMASLLAAASIRRESRSPCGPEARPRNCCR